MKKFHLQATIEQFHQKFNVWHSYSQNLKKSWKREKPEKYKQEEKEGKVKSEAVRGKPRNFYKDGLIK